jgi:DNA-binding MarR family transcriptional regulator
MFVGQAMSKPYYTLETLAPGKSVGFLIKRCGVLMQQHAEARFAQLPITFTQWMVLATLLRAEWVSASQLSAELGHDMGALTRVVDGLERRGFVRRERSVRDRRSVEIAITPAGRKQAQTGKGLLVDLLNELIAPLAVKEVDELIGLLQRLMLHLQESAEARTVLPPPVPVPGAPAPRRRSRSAGAP